ncbi:hypothetical protein FOA52_013798 [Chlamydomonas sp. UWO 241]|nr:hypothetical protein FOA52_013798 [Chlamydomonas sp. UWO 241]
MGVVSLGILSVGLAFVQSTHPGDKSRTHVSSLEVLAMKEARRAAAAGGPNLSLRPNATLAGVNGVDGVDGVGGSHIAGGVSAVGVGMGVAALGPPKTGVVAWAAPLALVHHPGVATPEQLHAWAAALDPELMRSAPPLGSWLPGHKNPCWMVGSGVRCLPYAYIAGAHHSGSAAFSKALALHPEVALARAPRSQFWAEHGRSMEDFGKGGGGKMAEEVAEDPARKVLIDASASTFTFYWSAGIRPHRSFQASVGPCVANCTASAKGDKAKRAACMDATCLPTAMEADRKAAEALGLRHDDLHVPLLLAAAYAGGRPGGVDSPKDAPKMILMLRDPVERIHSAFWTYDHYRTKYGESEAGFLSYVKAQARFAADRGQMITIVSAYSPTEAASDEEAGDFYLRVAALADKANDKRDLLIVAGGSQRRAWDSSQLRRPAVRREFNLQLSDRFGLLEAVPPEGADAQAEYDAMAAAIREVATNHLAPRGSRRRRGWQFTLSQRTLRLMDARQRAHTAWLRSKSAAAKRERNRANRAADAAVQRDRERWIGQQVAEAQDMLRKKNLRQFARACDRLAGRSRSHQIPPAMRDVSGALHSGPDGVLKAMTESFDKLYGGETKLSDETLNQLENDVAAFELTRATEVDEAHGRPPDLAETEACVRALRSAAAPGGVEGVEGVKGVMGVEYEALGSSIGAMNECAASRLGAATAATAAGAHATQRRMLAGGRVEAAGGGDAQQLAGMRECALYFEALGQRQEELFFHADQVIRGMYAIFLEVWLRHLPHASIHVIRSEDYFFKPQNELKQAWDFLGFAPPSTDERFTRAVEKALAPPSSSATFSRASGKRPDMLPEARAMLSAFYKPWNDALDALLGYDGAFTRAWA